MKQLEKGLVEGITRLVVAVALILTGIKVIIVPEQTTLVEGLFCLIVGTMNIVEHRRVLLKKD